MIRFVTAAFGRPYLLAAQGLLRSFQQFAPDEVLTIFTDMPDELASPTTVEMEFSELLDELDDFYRKPDSSLKDVFKFGIFNRMQEMYPNDDICWIDADMLVFCNISSHLQAGKVNVMAHGRRDHQTVNCGGGLRVNGDRYAIGGMYSLPPGPALAYMVKTMQQIPNWEDGGGPLRNMADQLILNHLVARSALSVGWINDDRSRIFNLELGENVHPLVGDPGLSRIKLDGGVPVRDERQIAVFCWVKKKFDEHLENRFSTFQPEVARLLNSLYRIDGVNP